MEIRGKTISFSSYRAKERNKYMKSLLSEILNIETCLDENNKERLFQLQSELKELRQQKLKGYFARSKWIDDGEKVTNYF